MCVRRWQVLGSYDFKIRMIAVAKGDNKKYWIEYFDMQKEYPEYFPKKRKTNFKMIVG